MNDEMPTPAAHHDSWITTKKGQIIGGTIIAALIIMAGLVPLFVSVSETNARQDADRAQRIDADRKINSSVHLGEVRIACGFIRGLDTLTTPVSLANETDPAAIARIKTTNAQRAQVRNIIRDQMPDDIKVDVNKMCPATG